MDFTQMPVLQGHKYLLVMIDTFTGWIEGFPTQTEKAEEVVKKKKIQDIRLWSVNQDPKNSKEPPLYALRTCVLIKIW